MEFIKLRALTAVSAAHALFSARTCLR